jgi:hypothetical protein
MAVARIVDSEVGQVEKWMYGIPSLGKTDPYD